MLHSNCGFVFVLLSCWMDRLMAWTTDDFAMFDLVEEIQREKFDDLDSSTFYSLLGVAQDATVSEIKRAYRKLSLQYHPDKNKAEDAGEKFRQLAAIYEVLKSEEQRQAYDQVLEFGLPDWRQPIFYYRSLRRMPLWETLLLLTVIISTAQWLMMWGAYWEHKITVQGALESKLRKQEKRLKRRNVDVDELIDEQLQEQLDSAYPSWRALLPFWLCRVTCHLIVSIPSFVIECWQRWKLRNAKDEEDEPDEDTNLGGRVRERVKVEHVEYDMATDVKPVSNMATLVRTTDSEQRLMTGAWSLEELNQLVRLSTQKFPVGTQNRWQQIADALSRRTDDVTQMIGRLKHVDPNEYYKLCEPSIEQKSAKLKPTVPNAADWSQAEQTQLETALQRIPKTDPHRWENIAECIPNRTKDECIARYKHLVQLVKQKKANSTKSS